MGDKNGISNRELFKELMDVVKASSDAGEKYVEVLKGMDGRLSRIEDLLVSHMWRIIIALIVALLAAVGIKLAIPFL